MSKHNWFRGIGQVQQRWHSTESTSPGSSFLSLLCSVALPTWTAIRIWLLVLVKKMMTHHWILQQTNHFLLHLQTNSDFINCPGLVNTAKENQEQCISPFLHPSFTPIIFPSLSLLPVLLLCCAFPPYWFTFLLSERVGLLLATSSQDPMRAGSQERRGRFLPSTLAKVHFW